MQYYLLACCFIILVVICSHNTSAQSDQARAHEQRYLGGLEQKPIEGYGGRSHFGRKKRRGEPCINTSECRPRLCCLRKGRSRTCERRGMLGHYCTDSQLKGGSYDEYCPCKLGQCYMFGGRSFGECWY